MMQLESRLKSVADREKWAARGASVAAKLKATKAVWFPPTPAKAGKKTAASARKTTKKAAKKGTGAARKSAGGAKKITKRANAKKS
jgi:hypothetical protein